MNKPIILTDKQKSLIIGSMLGDGSIQYNKGKGCLRIARVDTDADYLRWEFSILENFCVSGLKFEQTYDERTDKIYYRCRLSTKTLKEIGEYYDKWYIDGYKQVPTDLELNPLIMAIWFLDDGNISLKKGKPYLFEIKLATDGFTEKEVRFLAKKLEERYDQYFSVCKHEGKHIISASTNAAKAIIRDINPYIPIDVMERKTSKWRNKKSKINEDIQFGTRKGKLYEIQCEEDFLSCLQTFYENEKYTFSRTDLCIHLNWYRKRHGQNIPSGDRAEKYLQKYIDLGIIQLHQIVDRRTKIYKLVLEVARRHLKAS